MTEDVNQNENELFDDGGGNQPKTQPQPQQQKKAFDAKNYLNTRLADNEQKRTINIRIVLTEDIDGKKKFAIPVNIHSLKLSLNQNRQNKVAKGGYKSFICLNDHHVKDDLGQNGCPLCQKKFKIFEEANKVEDVNEKKAICKQAYSYDTKTSYIVRCIERGKEDEGIKFWRFNKHDDGSGPFDVIKEMWTTYHNAGINIFDYKNGIDLILTLTKAPKKNENSPEKTAIKIMTDVAPKPLGTDEQIEMWVNDTKDWKDMYRAKSFEYLALIADDKTPVFDAENKKWVAWVDEDEKKKVEQEAAQQLKEQPKPESKPATQPVVEEPEEELPF
jgi:hypothetical protein